ncbi:hypothetical protein S7711_07045 [Stachybotrys chartarum IBT 7711]|uniref:Uncharacterized protein n=1 Tax=Stachybotrys chartarum (strain CBS 109288 / IBT 7711) TaxID=1280523 RepID=A0A084ASL8_STACB|nr:hypothetical protein S7711_07045 [Stachybotrys chartarum IBT 7711]
MYQVPWHATEKPPDLPANVYSDQLNGTLPLAVGTTSLDALKTYAKAHSCIKLWNAAGMDDSSDAGQPGVAGATKRSGRIWGWVLVNYANQGIQLFTQNGTFYRKVRLAGPENAQRNTGTSPASTLGFTARRRWGLPRRLLANDLATDAMQPAPDAYAAFDNTALLGKPLALVHAGRSLELAADQLVTQASNDEAGSYTAIEGYLMMVGKYKGDEVK